METNDKEMKGTPVKIYLQINDEDEKPQDVGFFDLTGISWCSEQLNDSDIEYTLSTIADQQLQKIMDNLAAKTEQIKKWEAVADSWKEQLIDKDAYGCVLHAYNESRLILIEKNKEIQIRSNQVAELSEQVDLQHEMARADQVKLAEKDKEISVKTKITDHWRNEAGAFDLVCQNQSKEIAFLKETLRKAGDRLIELEDYEFHDQIENLLK